MTETEQRVLQAAFDLAKAETGPYLDGKAIAETINRRITDDAKEIDRLRASNAELVEVAQAVVRRIESAARKFRIFDGPFPERDALVAAIAKARQPRGASNA